MSTVQYSIGFLSFANGGNIANMPLTEHILQVTVSSKTDIIGGTITNKKEVPLQIKGNLRALSVTKIYGPGLDPDLTKTNCKNDTFDTAGKFDHRMRTR